MGKTEIQQLQERLIPSGKIVLRDYQERQVNFVEKKMITNRIAGIQSSTGSGKTFTAIALCMNQLRKHPEQNVCIITPFNHLVYVMAQRAIEYGFDPDDVKVLMGRGRSNCPIQWKKQHPGEPFEVFSEEFCGCKEDCLTGELEGQTRCKANRSACMKNIKEIPAERRDESGTIRKCGKLIVTNDAMFLASESMIDPSIVIIDEAHVFDDYYHESRIKRVSPQIFARVNEVIESNQILSQAFLEAMKNKKPLSLSTYQILEDQCRKAFTRRRYAQRSRNFAYNSELIKAKEIVEEKGEENCTRGELRAANRKWKPVYNNDQIAKKVEQALDEVRILSIQDDVNLYINLDPQDYFVDEFYHKFDFLEDSKYKIVLMSATIDDYTKFMFDIQDQDVYVEQKRFIDFTKSEFFTFPQMSEKTDWFHVKQNIAKFLELVQSKQTGLLLFTTIDHLNKTESEFNYQYGFKMFRSKDEFEAYNGKKILLGSKALFQGMDIPGLDFVALDKLPFLNFNEREQKLNEWLESKLAYKGFNPWTKRTLPLLINNIIQATGRLWRTVTDKGIVAVLDPRYSYHYLRNVYYRAITLPRPGIQEYSYVDKKKVNPLETDTNNIMSRDEAISYMKIAKEQSERDEWEFPTMESDIKMVLNNVHELECIYLMFEEKIKEDGKVVETKRPYPFSREEISQYRAGGRMTKQRKRAIGQWNASLAYLATIKDGLINGTIEVPSIIEYIGGEQPIHGEENIEAYKKRISQDEDAIDF